MDPPLSTEYAHTHISYSLLGARLHIKRQREGHNCSLLMLPDLKSLKEIKTWMR